MRIRLLSICAAALGLLLLAVCVKGDTARAAPGGLTSTLIDMHIPQPSAPLTVLYDQYDHPSPLYGTNSQQYEPTMTPYNDFGADDFVVPAGQTWTISEVDAAGAIFGNGPVHGFNVYLYTDAPGVPGSQIYTADNQSFTNPVQGEFAVQLATPAVVGPGTYWVMVQGIICWFCNEGQWNWTNRTMASNSVAAWTNPGDGWGTTCNDHWDHRWICQGDLPEPDQVFRLVGTSSGGNPTNTPMPNTPTPTPIITTTPTPTPLPCDVFNQGSTLTCSPPDTYNYSFAYSSYYCQVTSYITIYFEVSATNQGPWTNYDQRSEYHNFPATLAGTFVEPGIPAQYQYVRVEVLGVPPPAYGSVTSPIARCDQGAITQTPVTQTPTGTTVPPSQTPTGTTIPPSQSPSPTYPVPTTTCCYPSGSVSVVCTMPDTYAYDVALSNNTPNCTLTLHGPVSLDFEVSNDPNPFGTWTIVERRYVGDVSLPPGGAVVHLQGVFNEPNIPPPNTFYRVSWHMQYENCFGVWHTDGWGNAAFLCPGPTPTPGAGTPTVVPPTPCTVSFTDVLAGDTFYPFVRCLACRNVLGGYNDGTFRPGNNVTRGQAAKIISNAAGYAEPIPSTRQTFNDVPPTDTFWLWIERVALHGAISGYNCGGAGEPCPGSYYRPGNNLTRGQLAKVDANVAGFSEQIPSTQQTFRDVPPSDPFWAYIERVYLHGVIGGYNCGGVGEPCPGSYYRPGNNVTRGQSAKIVANTFYPNCQTP